MAKVVIDIPKNIWERVKNQKCTIEDIRMSLGAVAHGKLLDNIKKDSSTTYIIETPPTVTCDKMCGQCLYYVCHSAGMRKNEFCALGCNISDCSNKCSWYTPQATLLGGNNNGRSGDDRGYQESDT